jgi:hypothetical protein
MPDGLARHLYVVSNLQQIVLFAYQQAAIAFEVFF